MNESALPGDPYDDCDGCQRLLMEKRNLEFVVAQLTEHVKDLHRVLMQVVHEKQILTEHILKGDK